MNPRPSLAFGFAAALFYVLALALVVVVVAMIAPIVLGASLVTYLRARDG